MKRAAVLRKGGEPWELTELDLDEPKAGEVLIRMEAAGLCHSDEHIRNSGTARLPLVGGHEGAGVVEKTGPNVTRVKAGDRVACSYIPVCGVCRYCSTGKQNLCDWGKNVGIGCLTDGTFRFHDQDEDLGGMCVVGSFSQYAVLSEWSCVKIEDDIPFELAALVSCGVTTGFCSAIYAGDVRPGDTVVVFGTGGVGINAVQGARYAGGAEDGGRVRVMISATPDACADCLVPKDLMRGILGQALGVPDDAIDLTYPADAHSSPSPAPTTRPSREVTMARRTSPPFRADHVGSLLRPQRLLQARDDLAAGRITAADLTAVEDEEIPGAIAMQEEVGLQSATDGEFRRASWHMDFIYALGGVSKAPGHLAVKFRNAAGEIEFTPASIRIDGKLRIEDTIFADAFTFTKAHVTTAVPKLTIPSPNMVHYRGGPASVDPAVYPDMEGFWADLAAAYADEVRRLGELGCAYLQFDDTSLAYLNDPAQRAEISGRGEDADHLHLRYIKQINAAIKDKPAGLAVTTHMCRGNFRSSWVASGGYDFVAEALFSELNVDGFFLEYDDERSGGFEPLRFVPPGKMVVLGLVTTKRPELESKDDLKRRIDEAAKYVPLDQICLSGQCGFSSTSEGNTLTYDEQVAKLRLIVEVARDVWGE